VKLAVIINGLSRTGGGVFEAVRRSAQEMHRAGTVMHVVGVGNKLSDQEMRTWLPLEPVVLPCRGPASLAYASGLAETIWSSHPDSIDVHGLWQYKSVAVPRSARKLGCSYVVHPHGMLDPWAVGNSYWKKRFVDWLFERRHLTGAACLRALCRAEARAIRSYGLANPICIIPNAIDVPCPAPRPADHECTVPGQSLFPREAAGEDISPFPGGRRVLLYLGRIHPKKGLSNLIEAWAAVIKSRTGHIEPWLLAIAGWDQECHERQLRQQAADLGLSEHMAFLGPRFDGHKAACYRHCDAFILPSFSEGLPMVVLEAWSYGKPTLMTPECNLEEGFSRGAALRIETLPESIAAGIHTLLEMTASQRNEIGDRGRKLVKQQFSWPLVTQQLLAVHHWTVGGGPPPANVQFFE
jgi:glycosyltransferase involved in cell wall biosynthesis